MYIIKPLKIILEMQGVPYIAILEPLSQMISKVQHMSADMARNILV